MFRSSRVACYGIIYMLDSLQIGFYLAFGDMAIKGLQNEYPDWDRNQNEKKVSIFNSYVSLFGSVGGFFICLLEYFTNVKKSATILNLIGAVSWIMFYLFSPKLFTIGIILHYIQGLLMGGYACITPILMTSVSSDDTVGMLGCMHQIGILLGMIVFIFISLFTNYHILTIVGMVCNLLSAVFLWITPNSLGYEKQDCIRNTFSKNNVKKLLVGVMVMAFQQLCVNPYLDNLSEILSNTGINLKGDLPSALTSSTQLISMVIAAFNMDGIGPKKNVVYFYLWNVTQSNFVYYFTKFEK